MADVVCFIKLSDGIGASLDVPVLRLPVTNVTGCLFEWRPRHAAALQRSMRFIS